ncbi:unnamed protein product [Rhizophagus irregularis]|uniref:Uncharacterized protein n=2 Tax=Rhizophagus irregularis TaxID=588596 RepID=A0A915ZN15_9GLOM|nr:unnamed protein product [Rhizophagus irregularis]CAB5383998.1 unnamed protein product [Rhizophagus irregularis]
MAFKERERRWQHREETMATNREREAERDLDAREKRSGNNGEKISGMGDDIEADSDQEEYYKDRYWISLVVPSTTVQSTRILEELDENILSKKLQPFSAEDLTKGMMMTLDEESELFVKKEIMAYVNF